MRASLAAIGLGVLSQSFNSIAQIVVINTLDAGAGSLRQAIMDANLASPTGETVIFNIPMGDPGYDGTYWTITPASALPAITRSETIIDGYSQPGSAVATGGTPAQLRIIVDGNASGNTTLTINGNNITIKGLVVNNAPFNLANIFVQNGDAANIEGCYLATTPDGTDKDASTSEGISIENTTTNAIIGGTTPAERNVISGNTGIGLSEDITGIQVIGNYIGVQPDGVTLMPTGTRGGVRIALNAGGKVTIGGTNAGEGNIIGGNGQFSGEDGVFTVFNSGGYTILGNSFIENVGLGIDVNDNGVTANDGSGEADGVQNYPVIIDVANSGADLDISGTLQSTPSTDFRIEFFGSSTRDPSGFGEGETYLGFTNVTTDGGGLAAFPVTITGFNLPNGHIITATATSFIGLVFGNTSEFSAHFARPFITTWKTDNPGTSGTNQVTIPTLGGGYNYDIYWEEVGLPLNNGTEPQGQTGDHTITFPSIGTYLIEISGDFPQIVFNNGGDREKILTIEQWGDIKWTQMNSAYQGCVNLTYNATDAPDLRGVTDLAEMFSGATSFNGNINNWDVSTIIFMNSLFQSASSFNQPLNSWDVSNVTNMFGTFDFATSFDLDLLHLTGQ